MERSGTVPTNSPRKVCWARSRLATVGCSPHKWYPIIYIAPSTTPSFRLMSVPPWTAWYWNNGLMEGILDSSWTVSPLPFGLVTLI